MIHLFPGAVLSFTGANEFAGQDLVGIASRRYIEIVGDYRLRETETITNPWQIEMAGDDFNLILPSGRGFADVELIPSLLIYLKILIEIGMASYNTSIAYGILDESYSGTIGTLRIPLHTANFVVLTRITEEMGIERIKFTLADLDWRDFIVDRESLTDPEIAALDKELKQRTEFIPPPN